MDKKEAKYNTLFNKYIRESKTYFYYELKQTKANSISWNKIEHHQLEKLLAAEEHGLVWKLSDQDQRKKPFDGFSSPPQPAFVVIYFTDTFYMIPVKAFAYAKEHSGERTLTREFATDLSEKVIRT